MCIARPHPASLLAFVVLVVMTSLATTTVTAAVPAPPPPVGDTDELEVSDDVAVEPVAEDAEIEARLTRILVASGWFEAPAVRVEEGIVFLAGRSYSQEHKDWATRLARNTQDVLAVVNRIEVVPRSIWDLSPTWDRLRELARQAVRGVPLLLVGALLLIVTWYLAKWAVRGALALLGHRVGSGLLAEVLARAVAVPVLVLGLYVVLNISGLTGLALSVVGGTGLIGLIVGFAFRDIAENFLASLLISMQRPFATGDLITVAGFTGVVQRVNTRATLLMTLDGNHVQIPNATIYKEAITNFTANPRQQFNFRVGIGYDDRISAAQTVARQVLREHESVLADPEPLVLAEALGTSTVELRIYFWVDISHHSGPKVRSSVIRLVKRALDQAGISMPDEAREVVFPKGVPIRQLPAEDEPAPAPPGEAQAAEAAGEDASQAHEAEGHLTSDMARLEEQARKSRLPEGGQNLLD